MRGIVGQLFTLAALLVAVAYFAPATRSEFIGVSQRALAVSRNTASQLVVPSRSRMLLGTRVYTGAV